MADKYVQLHPTTNDTGIPILDEDTNLYPIIGPDSFKNFDPDEASPGIFKPQAKLIDSGTGQNLKKIKFSEVSGPQSLLGTGNLLIDLLNLLYPIGSIYTSVVASETCPIETALGGTWERVKERFLYAAGDEDTVGNVGGSKDAVVVEHSHTTNTVPAHSHSIRNTSLTGRITMPGKGNTVFCNDYIAGLSGYNEYFAAATENQLFPEGIFKNGVTYEQVSLSPPLYGSESNGGTRTVTRVNVNATHNHIMDSAGAHSHTVNQTGVDGTNKNMPPYLIVYMWKRIA